MAVTGIKGKWRLVRKELKELDYHRAGNLGPYGSPERHAEVRAQAEEAKKNHIAAAKKFARKDRVKLPNGCYAIVDEVDARTGTVTVRLATGSTSSYSPNVLEKA